MNFCVFLLLWYNDMICCMFFFVYSFYKNCYKDEYKDMFDIVKSLNYWCIYNIN